LRSWSRRLRDSFGSGASIGMKGSGDGLRPGAPKGRGIGSRAGLPATGYTKGCAWENENDQNTLDKLDKLNKLNKL